tara:strand:+ start:383 stop:541 length:159 start_codon:yes stop_codon:yes gene_type:complete
VVYTAPSKFGLTTHSWFGTIAYRFDEMAHTGYDQGCIIPWIIAVQGSQWQVI